MSTKTENKQGEAVTLELTPIFHDVVTGRTCSVRKFGGEDWLCWKHPDGQWVTWRKATDDDLSRLRAAVARSHDQSPDQNWTLRVLNAAPMMTESETEFSGTYEAACDECRRIFKSTGRRASVHSLGSYWFHISNSGEVDLNRVPPIVRAPDDAFIDARGDVRRITKYGEDGPHGQRNYWLAPADAAISKAVPQ